MSLGSRPVLIVEDWADRREGHFPVRCAELAEGFASIGCVVDVLTSSGWAHAGEMPGVPFAVHRYGRGARALDRWSRALMSRRDDKVFASGLRGGSLLRVLAIVSATRARRRRARADPIVIVLSYRIDPFLVAAIAGSGSWLLYQFGPATPPRRGASGFFDRVVFRVAARAEARRRRSGHSVRIAAPAEAWARSWSEKGPFLRSLVVPLAGCKARAPIVDARARLGVAAGDRRIALVFGSHHDAKDLAVVWRAFAALDEWQLLVVGRATDSYRTRAQPVDESGQPILIDGHVDLVTRELAFAAADVVILSFQPGAFLNSGVLMDAISAGVPVVCSDDSAAAAIVRAYGLGTIFEPGNAHSLAQAMAAVPARAAPRDLERARHELSTGAVARQALLAMLDADPPVMPMGGAG